MSLKILLADDSMTAQNMGKKILTDAGHEVVAVSNGAAALKKIAESRPDLIIVDIYMPGYTGLEVCEKTKSAEATASVPVILTVGKLEPYRPEDGAKVNADGVIIKPFEATDLIGTVARIAERLIAAPASERIALGVPASQPAEAPGSQSAEPVAPVLAATAVAGVAVELPATPSFEVAAPDDASIPAFALEEPVAAPVNAIMIETPAPSSGSSFEVASAAPAFEAMAESAPGIPLEFLGSPAAALWTVPIIHEARIHLDEAKPAVEDQPAVDRPAVAEEEAPAVEPEALHVEPTPAPEVEFTCAPAVSVEVEQLNGLETHGPEQGASVEQFVDPALATDPAELMAFAVKIAPASDAELDAAEVAPEPQDETVVVEQVATISPEATVEGADAAVATQSAEEPAHSNASDIAVEPQPEVHAQVDSEEIVEIPVPAFVPPSAPEPLEAEVSTAIPERVEPAHLEVAPVEEAIAAELTAQPAEAPEPPAVADTEATVEPAADLAVVQQAEVIPTPPERPAVESVAPEIVEPAVEQVAVDTSESSEVIVEPAPIIADDAASQAEAEMNTALAAIAAEATQSADSVAQPPLRAAVNSERIASVVQRIFDRYKEQMISDIAKELSRDGE